MLNGKAAAMLDVIGISLFSILMIFAVMMILYGTVRLLPILFREKRDKAKGTPATVEAPAEEDGGELLAVITAAVHSSEQEHENESIFLARDIGCSQQQSQ